MANAKTGGLGPRGARGLDALFERSAPRAAVAPVVEQQVAEDKAAEACRSQCLAFNKIADMDPLFRAFGRQDTRIGQAAHIGCPKCQGSQERHEGKQEGTAEVADDEQAQQRTDDHREIR